jgi:hypothetical protein
MDALAVARALRGGVATLDALAARIGGPATRDELVWAVQDALDRGWISSSGGEDCGPDGLCGSSAPTVYSATERGRSAARSAG